MLNLEQTKSKFNETWRIPSQLSREHIPKRSLPKDLKKLENSREDQSGLGFTQEREKLQFVRTRDSRGFGTRIDGLESSQRVQQNTNPRACLLQTQNTPKEENSSPKMQGRKGRTKTQHTRVNLKPISFMNLRGIHLYKARVIRPSSTL